MQSPIIDTSTLTEEQIEAIKERYIDSITIPDNIYPILALHNAIGETNIFHWLFGEKLFKDLKSRNYDTTR